MALSNFLKKLIIFDAVWGTRSKKLAGINDGNNLTNESVVFSSVDNSIAFSTPNPPEFFQEDQYFRVFGGPNDGSLLRVKEIQGNKIITYENVIAGSGAVTLDARLWVVHNNPAITRPTSTGSTMWNVHNRDDTGVEGDASKLAITFAEHYHDEAGAEDDKGELISTEYNAMGCKSMVKSDCCDGPYLDLGPQLIFDDEGNALMVKSDPELGDC